MAKKDWIEIVDKFNKEDSKYLTDFLNSNDIFAPSCNFINIFDKENRFNDFDRFNLNKDKPANWIPLYKTDDLTEYLLENKLSPIRSGQGSFFFYKGDIFFDTDAKYNSIDMDLVEPIDDFVPLSLEVDFQKNENAFLNKAIAKGIISHFIHEKKLKVLEKEVSNKNGKRLLYGQFGKIKTTFDLFFKTSKGCKVINKGFQFEMDLVLESEDEIYIFEAKSGKQKTKSFCLLQLYYPLIYLQFITSFRKKIRTIFIDITTENNTELYRLMELEFKNDNFDEVILKEANSYGISNSEYLLNDLLEK